MARHTARERGEGKAGLIIALIIVAFAIFAGIKFVPVYVAAYDLKDTLRLETQSAALRTDKQIIGVVLKKGKELDLPIGKKNIYVKRTNGDFTLRVHFVKPLDMALFTYNFRFDEKYNAPLF